MPRTLIGRTPDGNICEVEYIVRLDKENIRLSLCECDEEGMHTNPRKLIDVREKDLICWIGLVLTEAAITRRD